MALKQAGARPARGAERVQRMPAQGTGLRPWDRQPGETEVAFAAFLTYRDSGPPRNLSAAARALGKHESLLRRWSAANRWRERLLALDSDRARINEEATREESEKIRSSCTRAAEHLVQLVTGKFLGKVIRDEETGRLSLGPSVTLREAVAIGRFALELLRDMNGHGQASDSPTDVDAELRRIDTQQLEELKRLADEYAATGKENR
jgi:hypothetical protein